MRIGPAVTAIIVATCLFGVVIGVRTVAIMEARTLYELKVGLNIDTATDAVSSSLNRNFQALRDVDVVVSHAIAADVSPTRAFHSYVSGTDIIDEFPALRGMGIFEYVNADGLDELLTIHNSDNFRREFGYPTLAFKNLSGGPQHAIITMFAPLSRGLPEIGVDLMARDRAETLNKAIQNRSLAISAPFTLFTDETAVSIFRPYYITENAQAPAGFVATALAVDTLLNQLREQFAPYDLQFSITDMGALDASLGAREEVLLGSNMLATTDHNTVRDLKVGGRIWRLRFRPGVGPPALFEFDIVTLLAAIASLLSGLLVVRSLGAATVLNTKVQDKTKQLDEERLDAINKAKHDPLTGLLNRRGLESEYHLAITANPRHPPTLISFDLDNFKQINDTLGHVSGDELLCAFAAALRDFSPDGTFTARFGGDEFCVLFFAPLKEVSGFADTIVKWSRIPISIDDNLMRFGVSAGIAKGETLTAELATLIVNADIALYTAKDMGRDGCQIFTDEMRQRVLETKRLADDIRRGIDNDEFVPYFQTQHDATTHAIVGVEALVRWIHPRRGVLPPAAFLDIANKTGVLKSMDQRTLELTTAAIARLETVGIEIPKYSVNVSLNRLIDRNLVASFADLPNTKSQLCLEILESDFLDDPSSELLFALDTIRDINVGIEVDDFGSGRASIIALKHLNPDRLKIDKSLIMPLCTDPHHGQFVTLIVEMASALGIAVTAEGVETAEQANILADLGVDTLQGFYFSKPCSEGELKRIHMSDAA